MPIFSLNFEFLTRSIMAEQEKNETPFIGFMSRIRKKTGTPDPSEEIKPFLGRRIMQELRGDILCEHLAQAILEAHGFVFDPSLGAKVMLCEKKVDGDKEFWPLAKGAKSCKPKATLEDDPSIATEKPEALCDYDIPETPVVVPKKHRGRKRTKQRTLEDELNPLRRSKNEVEEMLRRGLYKCVMEDADTDALDFDLDLDAILAGTHSVSTVSLFDVGHRAACCGSPRGRGQPACCRVSRGGRYDLHEAAVQSGSERVADRAERPRVLGENAEPSGRGHAVEATAGHALHGGPRAGAHVDARSGVLGERALRGAAGGQHERVRAARSGDRESDPRHRVRNAHRLRQEARAADVSLDRAARDAPLPPTHHQTTRFPRFHDSM